jgi:hypothetical protein
MLEDLHCQRQPCGWRGQEELSSQIRPDNKCIDLTHPPASLLGGYSVCDPPDPISNSAVKPDSANGTNAQALEE